MNKIDELKTARREVRKLKAAPADAHMDWCFESTFTNITCERPGTAAEELKKHAVTLTDARRTKGQR